MLEIQSAVRSVCLKFGRIVIFTLLLGACTRNPPSSGESPVTARLEQPPASASSLNRAPAVVETAKDWVEAARMERWDEVARLIDARDAGERQKPGTRYV